MPYAADTKVPISRTKTEIEELLYKHGADGFGYINEENRSVIAFRLEGRRIKFALEMPSIDDYARTRGNVRRNATQQQSAWEQACRQRWRALLLIIKAKFEMIELGVTTLEDEFLPHIMLPEGSTVGEWLAPQIELAYATGRMPLMLTEGLR